MGILFLLTEALVIKVSEACHRAKRFGQDPDLGRLFANLELLGIWNAAVSLVVPDLLYCHQSVRRAGH